MNLKRKLLTIIGFGLGIQLFTLLLGLGFFMQTLKIVPLLVLIGCGIVYLAHKPENTATDLGLSRWVRTAKINKLKTELRRLYISDNGINKVLRGKILGYTPISTMVSEKRRFKTKKGKFVDRTVRVKKEFAFFVVKTTLTGKEEYYLVDQERRTALKGDVILNDYNFMLEDNIYVTNTSKIETKAEIFDIENVEETKPDVLGLVSSMVGKVIDWDAYHKKKLQSDKTLELPESILGAKVGQNKNIEAGEEIDVIKGVKKDAKTGKTKKGK